MSDQSLFQIDQMLLTFPTVEPTKIVTILSYDPSQELFIELVKIFNIEMKDKIILIKKEFEARNFEELGKFAHRIRSTSLNLGTIRLAEIFKRLEYLSAEQNILSFEIQFLIEAAEKEYIFAAEKLNSYLQQETQGQAK
jgi:hypothetical protein